MKNYLLFLMLLPVIATYGQTGKNSLVLNFDGKKLAFDSTISSKGEKYTDIKLPVRVDYAELQIVINGKEKMDLSKFKTSVVLMKAIGTEKTDTVVAEEKGYTDITKLKLPDLFDKEKKLKAEIRKLVILFTYGDAKPLEILIEPSEEQIQANAAVNKATVSAACENPKFYYSYYLQPTAATKKSDVPFYVIEQDFSDVNNGPKIFKYEVSDNDPTTYKRTERRTLAAGRMATAVFKYFNLDYDKLAHQISFKDYNQEDRAVFQSLIGLSKTSDQPEAAADTTGKITGSTNENNKTKLMYDKVLDTLFKDLDNFRIDILKTTPTSAEFNFALDQVKQNIKTCLPDLKTVTPASLRELFQKVSDEAAYLSKVEQVVQLLVVIERYSAYVPPSFMIKNADELVSTVNYFKGDANTAAFSREFGLTILGGWKVDFSTGLIFSNLVDKKYLITDAEPVTETTTLPDGTEETEEVAMKKVIKETNSKFKIGFGILSHFYPRMTKWASLGITSGFIVKEDLAVQFPVGLSLMLGRSSRLVLSGGKVFGEISELSSRYNLDTVVKASALTNITEDKLTINRFKAGWFFGLTYNFGGTNLGGGNP